LERLLGDVMIKLINVTKAFGKKLALKSINLEIADGETLAIIGGSGSGKSTLLRLMIGLIQPTSGEIWIGNDEISHMNERDMMRVRLRMGMVFQYSALFDSMTVGQNVAFGLVEHTDYSKEQIQSIVREKLHQVGLDGVEERMPNELSGGMKKRVSLARAIAFGPEIIFYDEPSSGLDPITTNRIDELIIETQRALNVTSIVVTHDMVSACRIANRIAMVYNGELIAVDTPDNFKKIQDKRVKEFFRLID